VGKKKVKGSLKTSRLSADSKQPNKAVSQDISQKPSQDISQEPTKASRKGRVVITHSTYIPGLIDILEKLALNPEIKTITPAVISRVKANAPRFQLKVSVPITGGHKLIARKSQSAQEVFVITQWNKAELKDAIARLVP
jgi:hypothetical protein